MKTCQWKCSERNCWIKPLLTCTIVFFFSVRSVFLFLAISNIMNAIYLRLDNLIQKEFILQTEESAFQSVKCFNNNTSALSDTCHEKPRHILFFLHKNLFCLTNIEHMAVIWKTPLTKLYFICFENDQIHVQYESRQSIFANCHQMTEQRSKYE